MKQYDSNKDMRTKGVISNAEEYPHLKEVYMKVFGKPIPEPRKPNMVVNGRKIYSPDSEETEENEDAERASLFCALLSFN